MSIREHLWRALDDTEDLAVLLHGAKNQVLNGRDARFELRNAEVKLNKIVENFDKIIYEIDHPFPSVTE